MTTAAQQIFRRISILFFLPLACRCCFAGPAGEPTSFGEWAVSTNNPRPGLNLRARLVVSETADASGSRTAITYVEFQNTNNAINTIYVHSYFDLKCELRDSNGKVIPSSLWSYNGLIPEAAWLALPLDSTLRYRPNPPVVWQAKDGELLIGAGWGLWHIPRGDTNDYYLSGVLNLTIPKGETPPLPRHPAGDGTFATQNDGPNACQGTLKLPPVKISAKNVSGK